MKAINNKERQKAYFKFLFLFLATNIIIVCAIYYDFKIPKKENELFKSKIELSKFETDFQRRFFNNMKSINVMLDSLDIPGQNLSYQNSLISAKLVELKKSIPTKDSTFKYDMYSNIINLFVELQTLKSEVVAMSDSKRAIEEYKAALDRCRTDLKQTERDLYIARGAN
ncbi:MAG: hypothetical protein HWD82_06370 [Flavobacteriaceae bacterium]|nr:hypothetical protein [Flavobacteriaceae bacterium]